jgi:hypothetical protein
LTGKVTLVDGSHYWETVGGGAAWAIDPPLGAPAQRKPLLKELVVEVQVESRDSIIPTFRLPRTSVRVTESILAAVDSNHSGSRLEVVTGAPGKRY